MESMNFAAEQLADQAQRLVGLVGAKRLNPKDRLFLVIGMTGSGKSTFVSRCTKRM
jgi:ABC-type proline/glycine betaine transport system ATPase subunit